MNFLPGSCKKACACFDSGADRVALLLVETKSFVILRTCRMLGSRVVQDVVPQRAHVPNSRILDVWVILLVVHGVGAYMIVGYLDP